MNIAERKAALSEIQYDPDGKIIWHTAICPVAAETSCDWQKPGWISKLSRIQAEKSHLAKRHPEVNVIEGKVTGK